MTIALGQKCKDRISGFEGTAVCRAEWLSGCTRITLQPRIGTDGKMPDMHTFDEPQLDIVDGTAAANPTPEKGGPRPDPMQAQAPA